MLLFLSLILSLSTDFLTAKHQVLIIQILYIIFIVLCPYCKTTFALLHPIQWIFYFIIDFINISGLSMLTYCYVIEEF